MKKKSSSSVPTSFLQKTFDMLNESSLSGTVSWSEDGSEFIIYNTNEFSEKVLPLYFKHSNFASFIRQLNMYDFHKLRSTSQEHIYKHPKFIRDHPEYLKDIHRKTPDNSWPLATRGSMKQPEMTPVINKLVQMHQTNIKYHSQITNLEDKVTDLTKKNKLLTDQLIENQDRMRGIEKALMFFANCMKGNSSSEEFGRVPLLFDNMLQLTENGNCYKKSKVEDDFVHSPLELSAFDEDIDLSPRSRRAYSINELESINSDPALDRHSDVDKLDFLLEH
jgi:hypothetical protein